MTCLHKVSRYIAEYDGPVMVRDHMKCEACGAEYSIVEGKWYIGESTDLHQDASAGDRPSPPITKEWCVAAADAEKVSALEWQITLLRSALENYGRHHPWCEGDAEKKCNCGLNALLAETAPNAATPPATE